MKPIAKVAIGALAIACAPLFGCASETPDAPAATTIPNPASEYCVAKGGKLEITRDSSGNEAGVCHLPDGTAIDEWELFRRDHPQTSS